MKIKLICVAGARPNFMKIAPLLRELRRHERFDCLLVHTGQHHDENMSGRFFRDLALPEPDHFLGVGSGTHAEQTAQILMRFEPVVQEEKPHAVIVVGDVNSTMACALTAAKLQIPVVHVEAGLRSFDRAMPEEINRVITDVISDLLLVTEQSGKENLLAEGVPESKIHTVGNLMVDSLLWNLSRARESDILTRLSLSKPFALATLHRPSNVDDMAQLAELMSTLAVISRELPICFPVHPRTKARTELTQLPRDHRIRFVEPLGYLDFLCLMSNSALVLSDSGGIQEETTALGIPCLTLRNNTERPATVELGTNTLAGTRRDTILPAYEEFKRAPKIGKVPHLWDGKAAVRCVEVFEEHF